jgi:hypothetical protein
VWKVFWELMMGKNDTMTAMPDEIIREIIGEMIRETTIGKRRMSGSAFIASSEDTHSRTT